MPRPHLIYCASALLLYAILSYTAISGKSATFDEPAHVMSSYVALHDGDFSVEPDHPPLWKYWAAAPLLFSPFSANTDTPVFRDIPHLAESEFPWAVATLYRTPGNDADTILARARFMMLLLGVALGAVTATFAYRLGGPVAACVAATLFALDPNFLAHSPLVKNDVAIALFIAALAYALHLLCQRVTPPRVLAVALCCAACVTTKLTGLLAAPILMLTLVSRSLLPARWPATGKWQLTTKFQRLGAAFALCSLCAVTTYVAIWAVYHFRFDPSPDPAVHYDTNQFLFRAAKADLHNSLHRDTATAEEFNAWRPDRTILLGQWALDHHVLPEAYLNGLIFAHAASLSRYAFLLGSSYTGGHWYYFPFATLVKLPLTTLLVLVLSPFAFFFARSRSSRPLHPVWLSIAPPVAVILLTTLPAGINIGLRHLFPIFPLLYVVAGVALTRLYAVRPKVARPAFLVATLALLVETVSVYPDFIPFFNVAAGGSRGGLHLLGDSNLDWGQDLPALAAWQRANPGRTLHLAYFGLADPAYYGIRYHNLPHGYRFAAAPADDTLPTTGVLAVSASNLQGIEFPRPDDNPYTPFLRRQPTQVLGGSIYLYDLGGN